MTGDPYRLIGLEDSSDYETYRGNLMPKFIQRQGIRDHKR